MGLKMFAKKAKNTAWWEMAKWWGYEKPVNLDQSIVIDNSGLFS